MIFAHKCNKAQARWRSLSTNPLAQRAFAAADSRKGPAIGKFLFGIYDAYMAENYLSVCTVTQHV